MDRDVIYMNNVVLKSWPKVDQKKNHDQKKNVVLKSKVLKDSGEGDK